MLTEEQIELLGDRLVPIYQELEQSIIADIARRVKKTGRFTETAELMAKALKEKGYSPAQIQKEVFKYMNADADYQKFVSENTIEHKKEVQALIDQAKKDAITEGDKLVIESGNMSFNNDMSLWESAGKTLTKTSAFNELVTAMSIQTNKELKNLTKTLGFKGVDGFTKLKNVYQHELDLALLKITSGNYSSQQALDECVRRMAKSGLRTIEYSSGRTMQLDTAARLSIRTASTQLSGQISLANATENGEDLVEVSSHFGARSDGSHGPSDHAYWQGKVYSLSGRISKKESIRLGYVIRKLEDATGYPHNPLGLKGCNCRHDFYTFFEGISKPTEWPDEPKPTKWNGKEYTYSEATTKQRSMERNIRATKREIEAQSALGGDTEQLRTRIKCQTAEYKAFSENCGISEKVNRLRIQTRSTDIEKTNAFKQYQKVVKKQKDDIIEIENYKKMLKKRNIIETSDSMRNLPIDGENSSISDLVDKDGKVKQRRVYGDDGMAKVDYDTTDHTHPKWHPTGAHKHTFNYENKKHRSGWKKLSNKDLKMNDDIIEKGVNYHEK
ncbi:phage minor capsid protein [Lachnospiraceae bacterium LCP25S3_G4]